MLALDGLEGFGAEDLTLALTSLTAIPIEWIRSMGLDPEVEVVVTRPIRLKTGASFDALWIRDGGRIEQTGISFCLPRSDPQNPIALIRWLRGEGTEQWSLGELWAGPVVRGWWRALESLDSDPSVREGEWQSWLAVDASRGLRVVVARRAEEIRLAHAAGARGALWQGALPAEAVLQMLVR